MSNQYYRLYSRFEEVDNLLKFLFIARNHIRTHRHAQFFFGLHIYQIARTVHCHTQFFRTQCLKQHGSLFRKVQILHRFFQTILRGICRCFGQEITDDHGNSRPTPLHLAHGGKRIRLCPRKCACLQPSKYFWQCILSPGNHKRVSHLAAVIQHQPVHMVQSQKGNHRAQILCQFCLALFSIVH